MSAGYDSLQLFAIIAPAVVLMGLCVLTWTVSLRRMNQVFRIQLCDVRKCRRFECWYPICFSRTRDVGRNPNVILTDPNISIPGEPGFNGTRSSQATITEDFGNTIDGFMHDVNQLNPILGFLLCCCFSPVLAVHYIYLYIKYMCCGYGRKRRVSTDQEFASRIKSSSLTGSAKVHPSLSSGSSEDVPLVYVSSTPTTTNSSLGDDPGPLRAASSDSFPSTPSFVPIRIQDAPTPTSLSSRRRNEPSNEFDELFQPFEVPIQPVDSSGSNGVDTPRNVSTAGIGTGSRTGPAAAAARSFFIPRPGHIRGGHSSSSADPVVVSSSSSAQRSSARELSDYPREVSSEPGTLVSSTAHSASSLSPPHPSAPSPASPRPASLLFSPSVSTLASLRSPTSSVPTTASSPAASPTPTSATHPEIVVSVPSSLSLRSIATPDATALPPLLLPHLDPRRSRTRNAPAPPLRQKVHGKNSPTALRVADFLPGGSRAKITPHSASKPRAVAFLGHAGAAGVRRPADAPVPKPGARVSQSGSAASMAVASPPRNGAGSMADSNPPAPEPAFVVPPMDRLSTFSSVNPNPRGELPHLRKSSLHPVHGSVRGKAPAAGNNADRRGIVNANGNSSENGSTEVVIIAPNGAVFDLETIRNSFRSPGPASASTPRRTSLLAVETTIPVAAQPQGGSPQPRTPVQPPPQTPATPEHLVTPIMRDQIFIFPGSPPK